MAIALTSAVGCTRMGISVCSRPFIAGGSAFYLLWANQAQAHGFSDHTAHSDPRRGLFFQSPWDCRPTRVATSGLDAGSSRSDCTRMRTPSPQMQPIPAAHGFSLTLTLYPRPLPIHGSSFTCPSLSGSSSHSFDPHSVSLVHCGRFTSGSCVMRPRGDLFLHRRWHSIVFAMILHPPATCHSHGGGGLMMQRPFCRRTDWRRARPLLPEL